MDEAATGELKRAIETQHGGKATLVQSVHVDEQFQGKPVWRGTVHVFALSGHPTAKRAYAWASSREGSTKRRFFAVLHVPPIISPALAVRAVVEPESRK